MKLIKLDTIEDFENLAENDLIIVKWDAYMQKHSNIYEIEAYNIQQVKRNQEEIICKIKGNIYFNYAMHVRKTSHAEEVYKVVYIPF